MKRFLSIFIIVLVLLFALTACGKDGKDGKDGLTPTIEISEDGYWVINGEKTNVKAEGGNVGSATAENAQGLDFYLKDDGTYAVAIGNAKYLSEIVIPETYLGKAVTEIADYGFNSAQNLKNLKKVTIPDSVISIGSEAFSYCESLTSVVIGDGVITIGYGAFYGCKSLTSVAIPDTVTSIGDYAFSFCESLTSVVIPDNVSSIGEMAFYNCDRLTSVVIGNSVTSIGSRAFDGCSALNDVYYTGSEVEWGEIRIVTDDSGYSRLFYVTIHYNYVPEK